MEKSIKKCLKEKICIASDKNNGHNRGEWWCFMRGVVANLTKVNIILTYHIEGPSHCCKTLEWIHPRASKRSMDPHCGISSLWIHSQK